MCSPEFSLNPSLKQNNGLASTKCPTNSLWKRPLFWEGKAGLKSRRSSEGGRGFSFSGFLVVKAFLVSTIVLRRVLVAELPSSSPFAAMKRVLALLALVCVGGAVAMGVDRASEVPIHYSSQPPLALQQQAKAEQPRFAQAQAEAEGDDVVLEHEVDHVERVPHVPARGDNYVSFGAQPPVKVPEHEDSFAKDVAAQSAAMDKEEREELDRVDTVMEESTNTMTQSARCLSMLLSRPPHTIRLAPARSCNMQCVRCGCDQQ
jgi:hypothetical protein